MRAETATPKPVAALLVSAAFALGLIGAYRLGQGRPERAPMAAATTVAASPDAAPADPGAAPTAMSSEVAVDIVDFVFAPDPLRITAGSTVRWTNKDAFAHTATSSDAPEAAAFDTGNLGTGESAGHTFDTPGTYAYVCAIHNSMTGTVVVE